MEAHKPHTEHDTIDDIWSGDTLRKDADLQTNSFLALGISTDGVALFKSSKTSLWPVYLLIQNLPPQVRFKGENIILCGIWQGSRKPDMNVLLKPVVKSIQQLKEHGVIIQTPIGPKLYHAKLVLGIFDAPAKASVLCEKQFNGEFGCPTCLHPGKRIQNGARVYLPKKYPLRTHKDVIDDGMEALRTGTAINGVLGISPLADSLDLVKSVPVDYMHPLLEGVTRMLINLWFNSSNHKCPFYLGNKISEIDAVLLKQRPPHEISRCPRSILHRNYWKASELKNWLLYYSLPLLQGYLPPLYLHHFALFVCAVHILLQEKITSDQINAAELMLNEFYDMVPDLYGDKTCTYNMHQLNHVANYVRLLGPLWTHSAFCTESKNGLLKHMYHGKGNVLEQLVFNIDITQTLQFLHSSLAQHENMTVMHYLNLHFLPFHSHAYICVGEHAYLCGPGYSSPTTEEERNLLNCGDTIIKYSKYLKNNVLYCSKIISEKGKRNSSVCVYISDADKLMFGCIQFFINTPSPKAVVQPLLVCTSWYSDAGPCCRDNLKAYKELDLFTALDIFIKVQHSATSRLNCIFLDKIVSKAVLVEGHDNNLYAIRQPNKYDHN